MIIAGWLRPQKSDTVEPTLRTHGKSDGALLGYRIFAADVLLPPTGLHARRQWQ